MNELSIWDWIYAGGIIFLIVCIGAMFAIDVFKTNKPRTLATPRPNLLTPGNGYTEKPTVEKPWCEH